MTTHNNTEPEATDERPPPLEWDIRPLAGYFLKECKFTLPIGIGLGLLFGGGIGLGGGPIWLAVSCIVIPTSMPLMAAIAAYIQMDVWRK